MTETLPPVTGCRCPVPAVEAPWFWCDPHQCKKSAGMQRQCAASPAAFAAWSQGRGPGQGVAAAVRPAVVTETPTRSPRTWSWKSIAHFARALVKHARDWFRKCSQREIQARLAICKTCDQFTGTACAQCGCRVNLEQRFRNKLAWRSEACPLGKWPALAKTRWSRPVGVSSNLNRGRPPIPKPQPETERRS